MQHFRNLKNPKNLPIDLTGVRQIEWETKAASRDVTPTVRAPHDGKTYRDVHGDPANKHNKKA
jgi:hypothetical protein